MNLNKLLKPTSVAVIGASEKEGFGGDVCRNILSYVEDRSHVYFIHPKRDSVFGVPCYKSISDVPENVDLMVICTSQKTVIPLLQEGAKKGVGGAVVFASGYGEVGTAEGKQNEAELIAAAKELDIAVMGPNCAGFVNYIDNVQAFAFISAKRDRKGSVGVVSQSGQLCLSMMDDPGMRFSYNISAGNGKIVQMEDYMDFLVDDEDTKVVSIYIEGVKNAILTAVKDAGPNACPPMVVGVGIGGTFEKCAILAKKALTRNLEEKSDIEYVRNLESEMLEKINKLGIGPGGLGGTQTALAVNIETYPTHIAGLPVAVNICCHVNRHVKREL